MRAGQKSLLPSAHHWPEFLDSERPLKSEKHKGDGDGRTLEVKLELQGPAASPLLGNRQGPVIAGPSFLTTEQERETC